MLRLHSDDVMCRSHKRDEIFIVCREKNEMGGYMNRYADKDGMNQTWTLKKKYPINF